LLENVADSVSDGGLEGYASRVESRKVYANELAWLEDCVHRQMFTLSQGKCKSAAPGTTTPLPPWTTDGGSSIKSPVPFTIVGRVRSRLLQTKPELKTFRRASSKFVVLKSPFARCARLPESPA